MISSTNKLTSFQPDWLYETLSISRPVEGQSITISDQEFLMLNGLLRSQTLVSELQKQTEKAFGFKWKKRDTYESGPSLKRVREWMRERYGDVLAMSWLKKSGDLPIVLDAGCGSAMSGMEMFGPVMDRIRYLGIDVSEAVDVACERFAEQKLKAAFMQADITNLPLPENSIDVIFSEGVLHHTDSTEDAIKALAEKIKPGGYFMFYVYRKKGPVREFTDDYIREKMQSMSEEDGWNIMLPLTKLGKMLGDLNIEVDIPEDVDLLEIPAGKINLQRLFYWHVFKAFHHPELTLDEMNHINYDWYAPANAHRQTPQQVRRWCGEAGLDVEREVIEDAGITIIARKLTR